MVIVGISFVAHEASVALVIDGKPKQAIARERLTRIKRDGATWGSKRLDPSLGIRYCLAQNGLTLDDIDLVAWSSVNHATEASILESLEQEQSIDISKYPRLALPHHFAHACCSYYLSPFESTAVFVADGSGGSLRGLVQNCEGPERDAVHEGDVIIQNLRSDASHDAMELETFYFCESGKWHIIRKVVGDFVGIGATYACASLLLFGDFLDAGKTMGLAPYGKPYGEPCFMKRIISHGLPAFEMVQPPARLKAESKIEDYRKSGGVEYRQPVMADYAASVQLETEQALLTHTRWLKTHTNAETLCLSGGVALNCVANSLIARQSGYSQVFVPSAPGDDGTAIGCALYAASTHDKLINRNLRRTRSVFLGHKHCHNAEEICALGFERCAIEGQTFEEAVSDILASGEVVAWFQGGSEFGPRALGHRSFLADPRRADMVDYLNRTVKQREPFRPFAPVVLDDAVLEYFDYHHPSPYMSFVANVRAEMQEIVPAVTHIDGSARYQVLSRIDNPELYELIVAFRIRTGIPLLLNTSFNRAGEPIVETPAEAARCVTASSINYLVLDATVYRRSLDDRPVTWPDPTNRNA